MTFGTFISYAVVDSTLGSGQASCKDYLKDEHVTQKKANENHAQGFTSNSWPQVILPTTGKRLSENGTSLKQSRVKRGGKTSLYREDLQTLCEPRDSDQPEVRASLGLSCYLSK